MSILRHEADMRREGVVSGKHGITSLMLVLKEEKTEAEAILVNMHQGKIEPKNLKDKDETLTVMVHKVQNNETTILYLPT